MNLLPTNQQKFLYRFCESFSVENVYSYSKRNIGYIINEIKNLLGSYPKWSYICWAIDNIPTENIHQLQLTSAIRKGILKSIDDYATENIIFPVNMYDEDINLAKEIIDDRGIDGLIFILDYKETYQYMYEDIRFGFDKCNDLRREMVKYIVKYLKNVLTFI